MPTVIDIREAVKGAYKSSAWTIKVNRMSDAQVVAIFKRLREQNKI
jgi:predicted secreted protein